MLIPTPAALGGVQKIWCERVKARGPESGKKVNLPRSLLRVQQTSLRRRGSGGTPRPWRARLLPGFGHWVWRAGKGLCIQGRCPGPSLFSHMKRNLFIITYGHHEAPYTCGSVRPLPEIENWGEGTCVQLNTCHQPGSMCGLGCGSHMCRLVSKFVKLYTPNGYILLYVIIRRITK